MSYRVAGFDGSGDPTYVSNYYTQYLAADRYLETIQSVTTLLSTGGPQLSGATVRSYNGNRELVQVTDNHDSTQNRYFANNAQGQAMTVVQGNLTTALHQLNAFSAALSGVDASTFKAQHFYFADGKNVGTVGGLGARTSFDVNYTPLERLAATTPAQVVVQEGDTLRTLAARIYGDEALWYLIAEENGDLAPDAALLVGRSLRVPNQVVSLANDASTFKPFSVEQAIGDVILTQAAPPPRAEKGCGVVGTILVIVVVILVTYFSYGTGTGWAAQMGAAITGGTAGTGAAGAVGIGIAAAAGSVAGQAVGLAAGVQDKFSWTAVAAAGLTAGISYGIGAIPAFGGANANVGQLLVRGATTGLVNQGVNIALGLQESFSWRELAIASVSSAVVGKVAQGLEMAPAALQGAATSLTSSAVRLALGGRLEADAVLADVFGNVLGNGIVEGIETAKAERSSSAPAQTASPAAAASNSVQPVEKNPSDVSLFSGVRTVTPDERREVETKYGKPEVVAASSGARAASTGSASTDPGEAVVTWDESRGQYIATFQNGVMLGAESGGWGPPWGEAVTVTATRLSREQAARYDALTSGYGSLNEEMAMRIINRDRARQLAIANPANFSADLRLAQELGVPMDSLLAARAANLPRELRGAATMFDAGADDSGSLGSRAWNWLGEKEFQLVEAVKDPLELFTGVPKALANAVTGTVALFAEAAANHGAMEAGRDLGLGLDRTLELMQESRVSVRDFFDPMTFGYSSPAEAGWGLITDTGTLFVGGAPLVRGSRFAAGSEIGRLLKVASGGVRGEAPLSAAQRAEVDAYLRSFDLDGVVVRHVDDTNLNTGYAHGDMFSVLNIGSDVVPGNVGLGTLTANSKISIRGTIAHELVGHREAALMGRIQSINSLEEAQASIRAARFAPGLTSTERYTLLRDAITRLKTDGMRIRDYRDLLHIQQR